MTDDLRDLVTARRLIKDTLEQDGPGAVLDLMTTLGWDVVGWDNLAGGQYVVCHTDDDARRRHVLYRQISWAKENQKDRASWANDPGRPQAGTKEKIEMTQEDEPTDIYELLDAIEAVIKSSDPAKRETLAQTIDAYAEDFPEDFFWAVGAQAPLLLHHLLTAIDATCRPEAQSKPRPAIRLVERKPEGNA